MGNSVWRPSVGAALNTEQGLHSEVKGLLHMVLQPEVWVGEGSQV